MTKAEPKTVDVNDIVEQEAFGIGMHDTHQDIALWQAKEPQEILKFFSDDFTLIEDDGDIRPQWMCLRDRNFNKTERALLFALLMHQRATIAVTFSAQTNYSVYVTYCLDEDFDDDTWRCMSGDKTIESYVMCGMHLHVQEHGSEPSHMYLGQAPSFTAVAPNHQFYDYVRKNFIALKKK